MKVDDLLPQARCGEAQEDLLTFKNIKNMGKYGTNYRVAVHWLNNSYVMCNNIVEIDNSIFDNMRFSLYDEETDESEEIYQWFISDCSDSEVEYLEETFGLLFTYSDLLGCYILCVDHFGTSWDYVYCETTNEYAKRELGEAK